MFTKYKELEDKKVMIIGASSGIGSTLAKAFSYNGCYVIGTGRKSARPLHLNEYHKLDVRDSVPMIKANPVDIFIYNAGANISESIFEVSRESWEQIMGTNLTSMFFLCQQAAKNMIANQTNGVIINAGSFAAKLPSINSAIYAASKSAGLSLVKSLAAELAPYNIRVVSYSPGVVYTDMTKNKIEEHSNKMLNAIALHRFGATEDVAEAVLFLAVAKYMTGVDIPIDGGKYITQEKL